MYISDCVEILYDLPLQYTFYSSPRTNISFSNLPISRLLHR